MFKWLERLKAIRLTKTMIALALVSMGGLIWYVSSLPITLNQKIITLVLSGVMAFFVMLADDHASKDSYLDELRNVAEKLEKGE